MKLLETMSICNALAKNDDKNRIESILKNLTNIYVLLNNSKINENDLFQNMKIIETIVVNLMEANEWFNAIKKIEFDIFASNLLAITENEDFNSNIKLNIISIRKIVLNSIYEISNLIDFLNHSKLHYIFNSFLDYLADIFNDRKKLHIG